MAKVIILTLANKPFYLPEAIASLKVQTRQCEHIVEMDSGQYSSAYPPAVFFNTKIKELDPDSYVAWLSDDDLLLPNFVADLAGALDMHPDWDCVYGGCTHILHHPDLGNSVIRGLPVGGMNQIFNATNLPYCKMDGGQCMQRYRVFSKITYPYMPEEIQLAGACDGSLLNKLAIASNIYPCGTNVMVKRCTPQSGHGRWIQGTIAHHNWMLP